MLVALVIVFAVMVYALGHATKVWTRASGETRQSDAASGTLDSSSLTAEERQKMKDRMKEKLKQESGTETN